MKKKMDKKNREDVNGKDECDRLNVFDKGVLRSALFVMGIVRFFLFRYFVFLQQINKFCYQHMMNL